MTVVTWLLLASSVFALTLAAAAFAGRAKGIDGRRRIYIGGTFLCVALASAAWALEDITHDEVFGVLMLVLLVAFFLLSHLGKRDRSGPPIAHAPHTSEG